jgi:hypothetical protein
VWLGLRLRPRLWSGFGFGFRFRFRFSANYLADGISYDREYWSANN